MCKYINDLEKDIEGNLEDKSSRIIPGLLSPKDSETIYFSAASQKKAKELFNKILDFTNPPFAQFGGASESGCAIRIPSGTTFYSLSYHGDLPGWLKDIEIGAKHFNSFLAKIRGNNFEINSGEIFKLNECDIFFID